VAHETKNGPPVVGTMTGLGKGLGCGLVRFGSGAVDIFTFWVPGFNGVPVSDSYLDCMARGPHNEPQSSMDTAPVEPIAPAASAPSSWDVPTTEPGAAHAIEAEPVPAPAPKKTYSK
jgi:hypothetical protein